MAWIEQEYIVQLVTAFTSSLAFALLFNVRGKKILPAGLGGLVAWGVYLAVKPYIATDVARYFIASMALTFYGEIFARIMKSPATVFVVCSAIPLFPGGGLYKTMQYAVAGELENFTRQGTYTLLLALAIAAGMLCTMTIVNLISRKR